MPSDTPTLSRNSSASNLISLSTSRPLELAEEIPVVVIHPGSYSLKIGRASDVAPVVIPHCISRRRTNHGSVPQHIEDQWMSRTEWNHADRETQQLDGYEAACELLNSRPMSSGVFRNPTYPERLTAFNCSSKPEDTGTLSNVSWSDVSHQPRFLIGLEALMVNLDEPYNLHWPIRRGRLNTHAGVGGSLSSVLQDLEDLWVTAIKTHLNIDITAIKRYRAVLVIPDIHKRQHVRELVHLLLHRIGFLSVFLAQESVCATFGAGLSSACVVDVGDQKTSVTCVEDGLSVPSTRVVMSVGGSDVTRCLHWLLMKTGFPYKQCQVTRMIDALLMQDLKETCCHLDQDIQGTEDQKISVQWPMHKVYRYTVRLGDERMIAPFAFFFPDLFGLTPSSSQSDALKFYSEKYASDPSDPLDDEYLEQTISKHEKSARQRKKENAESQVSNQDGGSAADFSQGDDDDTMDQSEFSAGRTMNSQPITEEDSESMQEVNSGLIGLHEALCESIEKCDSEETKKRMYSCVLVVGGGLMFPGAQSWLQYLIWAQMSPQARQSLETMDVIVRPKYDVKLLPSCREDVKLLLASGRASGIKNLPHSQLVHNLFMDLLDETRLPSFTGNNDQDPRQTCWKGAAIMSSLDTAEELWISSSDWSKYGVRILREKASFVW